MKKRQNHTNYRNEEFSDISILMKVCVFYFVFGLTFSCIIPFTNTTIAIVEIHDHTDDEVPELADGQPKYEMRIRPLKPYFMTHNIEGNNWSSSSYFSELHSDILTPPPDFNA